jgi:predicted exporter
MSQHGNHGLDASASRPSRRERLQALLFTAASMGTTLLALGLLADSKLPMYLGE